MKRHTTGQLATILFFALFLSGCNTVQTGATATSEPLNQESGQNPSASSTSISQYPEPDLTGYDFPDSIDPSKRYLFYLHGKIIEDQGIPAISPAFGEYEYEAILQKLENFGFEVVSEQRPRNANVMDSARKIADQVTTLLEAGVQASSITLVGASKGAGIAIYVSYLLENKEINFVIMGICHPDIVEELTRNQIFLYGNVLSIYDSIDEYAGSCQDLFSLSDGIGISSHEEIVLNIGTGHGILYQPLDDWILPAVRWAGKDRE